MWIDPVSKWVRTFEIGGVIKTLDLYVPWKPRSRVPPEDVPPRNWTPGPLEVPVSVTHHTKERSFKVLGLSDAPVSLNFRGRVYLFSKFSWDRYHRNKNLILLIWPVGYIRFYRHFLPIMFTSVIPEMFQDILMTIADGFSNLYHRWHGRRSRNERIQRPNGVFLNDDCLFLSSPSMSVCRFLIRNDQKEGWI